MTHRHSPAAGGAGRLRILDDDDLRRLDAAALDVLAGVGFNVPSAPAREALVAAGAAADGARVTIPPGVVRELVARAPRRLTLGARAGRALMTGAGSLLTTDGCCVEIYDPESGDKRPTTAADVAAIARLVDALPAVDFCWPAVSAQDRPSEVRGLHELYAAVANTGKHVQTVTVVEPQEAAVAVEMARTLCDGDDERLRAEPPISALLGTVTPLGNDEGTLEAGLVFAAAGVPIGFVSMPMGGSTTPITMAGSLVVGIAETLGAVAAVQAAVPGAPVFICLIPSVMDLKTGDFTGGAPEDTVMGAATADIGRFYGLPTQCGVNSSGAKEPSWQSALDDATTTYLSLLAGVDMLTGVGMVSGGRIFSCEEMLLAVDAAERARAVAAGLTGATAAPAPASPVRPGAPASVAAPGEEAGPRLALPLVEPAPGAPTARSRAAQLALELLLTHEPPALAPSVDRRLRRLLGEA
jgi:trimethylamine--corrinoid protein Co-methyltransferase